SLTESEIITQLQSLLAQGLSRTEASRQLAQHTALTKRDIYQISLDIDIYSILQNKSKNDMVLD
ncbi:MAG: rRNA (cytidine-2'-O-)-methyltransferase, partial [Phormidesmis priestleyi]